MILIAQSAAEIYQGQQDAAIAVREVVEDIQEWLIESVLFQWVTGFALALAGALLVLYILSVLRQYSKEKDPTPIFIGLAYSFFVITLLFNNGDGGHIGKIGRHAAEAINLASEIPLELLNETTGVASNLVEEAGVRSTAVSIRDQGIRNCLSVEEGQKRDECLTDMINSVEELVSPYVSAGGGGSLFDFGDGLQIRPWPEEVLTEAKEAAQPYFNNPGSFNTNNFGERAFGGLTDIFGIGIAGFLFVVGTVFTYFAGIAQTIQIFMAPLATSLSFTKVFRNSFAGLIKSFIEVGLMKLVFNLMVGLAAWANLASPSPDPILFPLLVALTSLAFSAALVYKQGGGLLAAQGQAVAGTFLAARYGRNLLAGRR